MNNKIKNATPTFYDGITGSFAAGKQMKPLVECLKPDTEEA